MRYFVTHEDTKSSSALCDRDLASNWRIYHFQQIFILFICVKCECFCNLGPVRLIRGKLGNKLQSTILQCCMCIIVVDRNFFLQTLRRKMQNKPFSLLLKEFRETFSQHFPALPNPPTVLPNLNFLSSLFLLRVVSQLYTIERDFNK